MFSVSGPVAGIGIADWFETKKDGNRERPWSPLKLSSRWDSVTV